MGGVKMPMPYGNPRTYPGHSGVDFPQNRGTPIRASGPGVVLRTPYTLRGGYWTTIRYDVGVTVGYAHQDKPVTDVKAGDRVREGTIIGRIGSKGLLSTGPHLHMEIIGAGTYAAVWQWFDRTRVVGAPAPAATPQPTPSTTEPAPEPEEEDDDMFKPTVHARTNGKGDADEWMLGHPGIGADLPVFEGTATDTNSRLTADKSVKVFRGFMVTVDRDVFTAWARTYAKGTGEITSSTDRAGYIAIQKQLSRVSDELT